MYLLGSAVEETYIHTYWITASYLVRSPAVEHETKICERDNQVDDDCKNR